MRALAREVQEDLDDLRQTVDRYRAGALSAEEFKPCRLQRGVYGIRGLVDKQMLRVKVPAGRISADQFDALARVIEEYATGRAHLTTRQDVQCYEVPVERVPDALTRLAEAGLTTREACGNSVRNVTACPLSGLCADELFEVWPYALAITRHFLRNPHTQALPRKFKISVSGCRHDCAVAKIHDIGAVAVREGEGAGARYGFRLHVGGGLGAARRVAEVLEPFTAVEDLLPTCEAIVRVFDRHGRRDNKARARMKFLLERVGIEEFRRLVGAVREELRGERPRFAVLPQPQPLPRAEARPSWPDRGTALYRRWLATNVEPQRQDGVAVATVRLPLGDLRVPQMRALAALSRRVGRGLLILTQWQDLCLPWVRAEELSAVYEELTRLDLAAAEAQRIQDITACPGADTCQIGITSSRGLASELTRLLERPEFTTEDLRAVRIKISGCPNSCGQHHIADIGFHGASRVVEGQPVPMYQLLVGGGFVDGDGGGFGAPVVRLPAKHVPQALERLLAWYRSQRQEGESFRALIRRAGVAPLQALLSPLAGVGAKAEEPDAYRDWGQGADFTLLGMGKGECAG
jgi:sulfite reductase beta subunit-like hemoprotein